MTFFGRNYEEGGVQGRMDKSDYVVCKNYYSVLVNGEPCGMIHPTRGIRQGDPISHFPFLIFALH